MAIEDSINTAKAATGRFFRRLLIWLFVLLLLGFLLFWLSTKLSYSTGERAGVVSKFSERGYLLKTYEGELNVGAQSQDGVFAQNLWAFSVPEDNPEITQPLKDAMLSGKRVRLHYEQKYMKYFWLGDTTYYVTKVDVLP